MTDVTRRTLIGSAVAAGLATCCGCGRDNGEEGGGGPTGKTTVAADASGQATLDFASYPELKTVGGSVRVDVKTSGGATRTLSVTRTADATVAAVLAVCTHAGCVLDEYAAGKLHCSCHGAEFTADGKVTSGPARTDLRSYAGKLTDGGVVVTVG